MPPYKDIILIYDEIDPHSKLIINKQKDFR